MNTKKNIGIVILKIIICVIVFAVLFFVNLDALEDKCVFLQTFKANIRWIENIVESYSQLFFAVIIFTVAIWAAFKISISVKNVSFAGFDISVKDSDKAVKNSVKNYLNTKRSLFVFKPEYDNICEVLDSYHCIYDFLRTQMLGYEGKRKKDSIIYAEIQKMLEELNEFLTVNQSDYRRWFAFYERKKSDSFITLWEMQKEYPRFDELMKDFTAINISMRNHAQFFNIDILDWEYEMTSNDCEGTDTE